MSATDLVSPSALSNDVLNPGKGQKVFLNGEEIYAVDGPFELLSVSIVTSQGEGAKVGVEGKGDVNIVLTFDEPGPMRLSVREALKAEVEREYIEATGGTVGFEIPVVEETEEVKEEVEFNGFQA